MVRDWAKVVDDTVGEWTEHWWFFGYGQAGWGLYITSWVSDENNSCISKILNLLEVMDLFQNFWNLYTLFPEILACVDIIANIC